MSIRNNDERLGTKDEGTNPPIVPEITASQTDHTMSTPMSFSTPTEIVDLPSQGQYYPNDHPMNGVDSIEIRFMTAKEEDILTSKPLLKKGIAIDRMLQNIIVDKSIKIDNLLIGDKNAIILAARITGYGPEYATKVPCPACANLQSYTFDLYGCKSKLGGVPEDDTSDAEETPNKTFVFTAPKTKAKVEVKLLDGNDEKALTRAAKTKKKHKLPETMLTDQFRTYIVSVNGIDDPAYIGSFIENMPALDSKYIRTKYREFVPNVDMKQIFECDTCGFEDDMEVPLTADFFWPR
jgi:hypothetical protein